MKRKPIGQGLVEFALILPLLLLLLLGVIEGARIAWAYITVQEAAREAVRFAVSGQPFNATGDPWTFGSSITDGYAGLCLSGIDNFGTCNTTDPTASNAIDRIEAISNVAIRHARGLPVQRYAIASSVYTATNYYDAPNTLGVLVRGQADETDSGTMDHAGREGLNVWVQVYYNVEIIDPLYGAIVRAVTGGRNFVQVSGSVQMQNEGVDAALGSVPPQGIATPAPPQGGGGGGAGGWQPIIMSPDGIQFAVGDMMRVRIEQHTAGNHYDIRLGGRIICSDVVANNFGIAEPSCQIPFDYPPGENYELISTLHGDAVKVAGGVYINITRVNAPTLRIADGNTWPAGSQITIQVRSHEPYQRYDIHFNGPTIGTTAQTDQHGDVDLVWRIPPGTPPREAPSYYPIESLAEGTATPLIAATGLHVTIPQILVRGGNTWPAGATLMANLLRHAPNRSYEVRCNGDPAGIFATDAEGRSTATIYCHVPASFPDTVPPNGYYTITSHDGSFLIGQADITIETPSAPYLTVVGGYDWPAGSPIEIQMFKHLPDRNYRLDFGNWVAMPSIRTDNGGYAQTAYIIPVTATAATTYTLRSWDIAAAQTTATRTLTVRAFPQLTVAEGSIVQPGTFIRINLTGHAAHTVYNLYLDGVHLGSILTGDAGQAVFGYDLNRFGRTGGPFVLESRLGGIRAAQTELTIVAADLEVVSIELPPNPVFNAPIPITVTVRNSSTVTLSGVYFDTDIYVDPEHVPDPLYPYPPGDFKMWINYLGPYGTAQFNQNIVLYGGGEHSIYARVNTSRYIRERDQADPVNNMRMVTVRPDRCAARVEEALTTDQELDSTWSAGWNAVAFGNANDTPATANRSMANDVISLTSEGSSPTQSNDSSGGYYLVYQQVNGDFDVSVRLTQQGNLPNGTLDGWARFGLEVRASTASTARKIYVMRSRSNGIQVGRRTSDGGSVTAQTIPNTTGSLPVWVRLVRYRNDFAVYHAFTANVPPAPGDWVYFNTFTVTMTDPVLVGLVNLSASATAANTVRFDNFRMCLDPTNLSGCGAVLERDGMVVVNATNPVQNVPRSSRQWQEVTQGGYRVMQSLPDSGTTIDTNVITTSPELQYQINFATAGDYYVWVYGAGPNTSGDSLHVGLNGALQGTNGRVALNSNNTLSWSNTNTGGSRVILTGISAGVNLINVYMREDGAWFYKLLLTTDPNFVPTRDVAQSACAVTAPAEPYPPGLMICTPPDRPLLRNGGFEENPGYQTAWVFSHQDGVNISADGNRSGSLSLLMASYRSGSGFKRPWCYQQFTMPDWITSTTTMKLSLWKLVDPMGTPEYTDTLRVVLRTSGMTPTLVSTPTVVARGNEGATEHYFGQWDLVPAMIASGQNPVNYASQPLQLYFYDDSNALNCMTFGPNCFATRFFLDDVVLEVCTSQPRPDPDPSKAIIRGTLRILQNGQRIPKQGVRVWAYRQNGAMLTTYSIHDSTYSFYGLDPGEYVIYSEWWDGADLYNALTTRQVSAGIEYTVNLELY